jgi:hypothetical protein
MGQVSGGPRIDLQILAVLCESPARKTWPMEQLSRMNATGMLLSEGRRLPARACNYDRTGRLSGIGCDAWITASPVIIGILHGSVINQIVVFLLSKTS